MNIYLKKTSAALLILFLFSCSEISVEKNMSNSRAFIEDGAYAKAVITLKQVISIERQNMMARSLLGETYVYLGDFVSAEKEFTRISNEQGLTPRETELLTIALFFQQDFETVSQTEINVDTTEYTKLLFAVSDLLVNQEFDRVDEWAGQNLGQPNSLTIFRAANDLRLSNSKEALIKLETVDDLEMFYPYLSVQLGIAKLQENDFQGASEIFAEILKKSSQFDLVSILKAETLIKLQDFEKAKTVIAALTDKYPDQPVVRKLLAFVNFYEKNFAVAKENAEFAINNGVSDPSVRATAAMASFSLENFEASYGHFLAIEDYVQQSPVLKSTFLFTKLKLGYEVDVTKELMQSNNDIELFPLLAGDALATLLNNNNKGLAREFAAKLTPEQIRGDQSLAKVLASLGNDDALKYFTKLFADEKSESAFSVLVTHYLAVKDYESAKELSQQMLVVAPSSRVALNTMLAINVKLENQTEAMNIAEKTLAIYPTDPLSVNYKAINLIANGIVDEAEALYKAALADKPFNMMLLKGYYQVNSRIGKPENTIKYFRAAYDNTPNTETESWLAKVLVESNKPNEVIKLLSSTSLNKVTPSYSWLALADSHTKIGEPEKATQILQEWVRRQPENKAAYIKLLMQENASIQVKNIDKIVATGLQKFPENDLFSLIAIQYVLEKGDASKAKMILERVDSDIKDSDLYKSQLGRYYLLIKDAKQALPLLLYIYETYPTFFNLTQLSNALILDMQSDMALSYIDEYISNNPDDIFSLMFKADVLIWTDQDKAIKQYKQLITKYPKNAIALNNLAYLMLEKDNVDSAIEYASAALDLVPSNPEFLDTLASAYVRQNKYSIAMTLLEKAIATQPNSLAIYLNYADLLHLTGKSADAKALVESFMGRDNRLDQELRERSRRYSK